MRPRHLGVYAVLLGACIPIEPEWLVTATRFRGVKVEVVEPGGYGSLLHVPPGRHRNTILPLDTVEVEWAVAAPPGVEVPPPIWIATDEDGPLNLDPNLPDCPEPLPLTVSRACRLGEGHRIRFGLLGAYTITTDRLSLLIVGSRHAGLEPATCLERLATLPYAQLEPCILGLWDLRLGPTWAALPFEPEASLVPPEVLAQDVNTNPEVIGFAVTRQRGSERSELEVGLGASLGVRPRDRITVTPLLADGSAQDYWITVGDEKDMPWSGTLQSQTEQIAVRTWFSAPVDEYVLDYDHWRDPPPTWVVPDHFEPTLLYLDVRDDRFGRDFAELLLVPDDAR